jgi:drug/metabolite transporter (DMT)-like permease
LLGQLAALGTSLCFSATSTLFTLAGRRVSALVVNRTRLLLAIAFLLLAHAFLGEPLPFGAEPFRLFWLGISGVIGLALGDVFLFQAFVWIGPRLSMLMMSLAPVLASLMGWLFLDESLSAGQMVGIALTIGGIAWVVLERNGTDVAGGAHNRQYLMGLLFGLGAAVGQAGGLVTAKFGSVGDFSALSGTLIRMVSAAMVMWVAAALSRQVGLTIRRVRDNPQALLYLVGGAFFGPFLGVTLSLYAIQRTPVGIASTLMALPPIFLLPIGRLVFKERFGWQAVTGTLIAILGVSLLFLV